MIKLWHRRFTNFFTAITRFDPNFEGGTWGTWSPPRSFLHALPVIGYLLFFGLTPALGSASTIPPSIRSPEIFITVLGCSPSPPDYWCPEVPSLIIHLVPVPKDDDQFNIAGEYDGHPFSCFGSSCVMALEQTPLEGVQMEFWVIPKSGAIRNRYSGLVRVLPYSELYSAQDQGFRVEIASSQYDPGFDHCCGTIWEALPPLENPPLWLTPPASAEELRTEAPYYFLAGRLIKVGYVDASACPGAGLQPNFYATECGLITAMDQVIEWQNQFDPSILHNANKIGVPALVLKRVFAQEGQFWPGNFKETSEYGLGHLTPTGADTLFLWDPLFYNRFCLRELGESRRCRLSYPLLMNWEQEDMRALLVIKSSAECKECEFGLDMTEIDFSIEIFAHTLKANATQTAQILWLTTDSAPGLQTNYQDLWRLTLVNYNVGPGCLSEAVLGTQSENLEINWENVAAHLIGDCQNAVEYVEDITRD